MNQGMRLSGILCGAALALSLAWTSAAAGDDPLAGLKGRPNDRVLLEKLKQSLAAVADTGERCRLGAVYCLGAMTYGDAADGLAMRGKMAKAFPSSPYVQELSDSVIFDACDACRGGKAEAACRKCGGGGACGVCGGGGLSKAKGFDGGDLPCAACKGGGKCAACSGTGKAEQSCRACGGRGTAISKDKCADAYAKLLQPAGELIRPWASARPSGAETGAQDAANPFGAGASAPAAKAAGDEPASSFMGAESRKAEKEERMRKAALDKAVSSAVARAREQVARTPVLGQYPVSYADVDRAFSDKYTTVQKRKALEDLWARAMPTANAKVRSLFMPFPSGLKFVVDDVEVSKKGPYVVSLSAYEDGRFGETVRDGMPAGTCYGITEALMPSPVQMPLLNCRLIIPGDDAEVPSWRKGRRIDSGEWIVSVFVMAGGGMRANEEVYRSQGELDAIFPVPGKPAAPPQVAAGSGAARASERGAELVMDMRVLRSVCKDSKDFELGVWYVRYQKACGIDFDRDRKAYDKAFQLSLELNVAGMAIVNESWAGMSDVPSAFIWEVESQGQLHLLMTDNQLPPSQNLSAKVRVVKTLPEFDDSKGFQRTPALLCLPRRGGSDSSQSVRPQAAQQPGPQSRESVCPACQGTGSLPCPGCRGSGQKQSNLPCSSCGGTGLRNGVRCPTCNGQRFMRGGICRECAGTGRSPCTSCGGTGRR